MIKELHTLQERFMKETEHFCQVMRDKEVSVKDKNESTLSDNDGTGF